MKMYILIKETIPLGIAINAAAHASLICHLKFSEDLEYQDWLKNSFKKVTCRINEEEFEKIKEISDNVIVTESFLDNEEIAIAFKPRKEYPKIFKYFKLYGS